MENKLPKKWVKCSLGEIIQTKKGKKPSSTIDYPEEGYVPYILIDEMEGKPVRSYTSDTKVSIVNEDEVLLVWDGSIGKCGSGLYGAIGSTLVALKPLCNIPTKFIEYTLIDKNSFIKQTSTGTGLQHINKDFFKDCVIGLPPLEEQNRIVAKLDTLFAQLETIKTSMENIPVLLKDFRQQVLTKAVTGKLTEEWRNVQKGDGKKLLDKALEEKNRLFVKIKKNKLEEFKFSENLFPKSWAIGIPGEIASPEKYSLSIGPFGSNLKVDDYCDHGVPLIFVRHIKANNFNRLSPRFVSIQKATELEAHSVEGLDLLITKMGEPPGECEIYPENMPKAIITADCIKFRVWDKYFNRLFYKYAINSSFVKEQLGLITFGVAQQKISLERFRSIKLPIPPLEEQLEIVSRVESLFIKADVIEHQYKSLKGKIDTLPQALLHKAFKGELTEQLESDGDARELLQQIKELKGATTKVAKNTKLEKLKSFNKKVKNYPENEIALGMVAESK